MISLYPDWLLMRRYRKVGMLYGDMISYGFMGEAVGLKRTYKKLLALEKEYVKRGYVRISRDDWLNAGGYAVPIDHLFGVKR